MMSMPSEHETLEAGLSRIRYPDGIVACSRGYCAIAGQSFYPGGRGHLGKRLPTGGVLYLGHNFDKVSGYEGSVQRGYEENLTWRSTKAAVLPHLSEESIWFTNYFMGVSKRDSNIGELERNAGFAEYELDCWDFFNLQVALQRPRIIVALGKHVVRVLSPPNRLNIPEWAIGPNGALGPLRSTMHKINLYHKANSLQTHIVAAYHPSYGRSATQLAAIAEDSVFIRSLLDRSQILPQGAGQQAAN